ncbi:MAG: hypothetical protein HYZ42_15850 [Bacteroidetes bacterium]|nr:hypothetical protein [Bacteroidota bacterium]
MPPFITTEFTIQLNLFYAIMNFHWMITTQQIVILLLVSNNKFANDYTLIKFIGRIWFPSNISENIDLLVSKGYIEPFVRKQYNQDYKLTDDAITLIRNLSLKELIDNDGVFKESNDFEKELLTKLYFRIQTEK